MSGSWTGARAEPGAAKAKTRALAWAWSWASATPRPRSPSRASLQRFAAWLARQGAEEARQRRLFLWLPVFFGAGVLVYFAADREPSPWPAALIALLCALGWARAAGGGRIAMGRALAALTFLFSGFACAAWRTQMEAAPALERMAVARATAFVEAIDLRPQGARLMLRLATLDGVAPERTPLRVRVNMRGAPDFEAGATISGTLRLLPPPRASEPGGYDFARDAYFQQLGAVGSLTKAPELTAPAQVPVSARLGAWIDRGRNALTLRIVSVIGGANGAVAAALVTGKRGLIPEETNEALRAAGVYHVVSISGLHMVLAAGLFMWTLRALLAAIPGVALRYPIKKWAAAFAMLGATAYNLFSGSEVATERALVMTLVLLGAVLFDRPAISMRNLAIAALIVLAREPSTLLGPSFQMSFAAVAAMIAVFERPAHPTRAEDRDAPPGALGRARTVLLVMLVTTGVASLATDPYATFHFHRITVYGLIGNSLTLPLVEFVVMPAAVFGVLASFFGLDAPIWWIMGQGVAFMMEVSHRVAVLPGAVRMTPAFGAGALLMMTLGLLWIVLWRSPLRWAGIVFALGGLALTFSARQPDVMIDARGQTLAWRGADGRLSVLNAKGNAFGVAQWLASDADARKPQDPSLAADGACDPDGCVARLPDGRTIALVLERSALAQDCARADIVVTRHFARGACKGPGTVFDGAHFEKMGATHLWMGDAGRVDMRTAREPGLDRPWWPAPARRAAPAVLAGAGAVSEPDEAQADPAPDLRLD